MNTNTKSFALLLLSIVAAALVAGLSLGYPAATVSADPLAPPPSTASGYAVRVPVNNLVVSSNVLTYSSSFDTSAYGVSEVFLNVDFATSGTVTLTIQGSPDSLLWSTNKFSALVSGSVEYDNYSIVLSADGTDHIVVPNLGLYARVALQNSGNYTGTVKVVSKDSGGQ